MSDPADFSDDHYYPVLDANVRVVREAASKIPVGEPGICGECEEPSGRLVNGSSSIAISCLRYPEQSGYPYTGQRDRTL